jgi:hypothetical protein
MVVPLGDPWECVTLRVTHLPLGGLAPGNGFDTVARCVYRHAGWLARVSRPRAQTSGHFPTRAVPTRAGAGG